MGNIQQILKTYKKKHVTYLNTFMLHVEMIKIFDALGK